MSLILLSGSFEAVNIFVEEMMKSAALSRYLSFCAVSVETPIVIQPVYITILWSMCMCSSYSDAIMQPGMLRMGVHKQTQQL